MRDRIGAPEPYVVMAVDPGNAESLDTLLVVPMPHDYEAAIGAAVALRLDLRKPDLLLSGNGIDRLLLARTDTPRVRVLDTTGRTIRWVPAGGPGRRYTRAEQAQIRQAADSSSRGGFAAGVAAGLRVRGDGRPMPTVPALEVEVLVPEQAPALTALVAGDRFLLVGRGDHLQRDGIVNWDILGYDGRRLGDVRLPPRMQLFALRRDWLYAVQKDELDVESVLILQLSPPR